MDVSGHLQNTTPVQAEDKDDETPRIQEHAHPVEIEEKVPGQSLSVQHAEGRWVCRNDERLATTIR